VQVLIDGGSYRLAYSAAYDIMRHAAEAVVTRAGARIAATQGVHEAVFALADALVADDTPGVFAPRRATPARLTRHRLEYISDVPIDVEEPDARQALQWATEAVAAATAFATRASVPRI
jgi:hypothetical protein